MANILPRTRLVEGRLEIASDADFDTLCDYGIFYLERPDHLDIAGGIKLAQSFYLEPNGGAEDAYRGYRTRNLEPSLLGHSSTGADQSELLQIEADLWRVHFPADVAKMLWGFNQLGKVVVRDVMLRAGVDPDDVDRVTGGMPRDVALQYSIFNHYRSTVAQPFGLTPHKDSGFITVLHSSEGGLDTQYGNQWVPVDPLDGHFTIVLGHSFEVLTAQMRRPVMGSYHRVNANNRRGSHQDERYSFGSYIGPRWDQILYQYSAAGELKEFQSFYDFQKAKAEEMGYEFHPKVAVPQT